MAKRARRKPPQTPSVAPFDARAEAAKIKQKIFDATVQTALNPQASIAAMQARKMLLELGGAEDVPQNYVVDLNLIEITQDDDGRIVVVKREAPKLCNTIPPRRVSRGSSTPPPSSSPSLPAGPVKQPTKRDPFTTGLS